MTNGNPVQSANDDPVRHVIVLALENRSFDHMLGACQATKPEIDGIPPGAPPRTNQFAGQTYQQRDGAAPSLSRTRGMKRRMCWFS
jgi:phospholipase C